jgi:hypothetical protein
MKIGTVLTVNALIATAFGIGFILAPAQVLAPYGVELPVAGLLMSRLFGASLLGYGILTWLLRGTSDAEVVRAFGVSLGVANALGAAVAAWGVLSGTVNAMGWSTVAIYAALAAGFGYFAARKPAAGAAG